MLAGHGLLNSAMQLRRKKPFKHCKYVAFLTEISQQVPGMSKTHVIKMTRRFNRVICK